MEKIMLGSGEYELSVLTVKDLLEIEKKYSTLNLAVDKIENVMFYLWLSARKKTAIEFDAFCESISVKDMSSGVLNQAFEKLAILNGWNTLSKNEVAGKVAESK